jgi:hypothetical protein
LTKEQANNLITEANNYKGRCVPINNNVNGIETDYYEFVNVDHLTGIGLETEEIDYYIYAVLKYEDNFVKAPLEKIIEYFKLHPIRIDE